MSEFLVSLLALISFYIQPVPPESLPSFNHQEFLERKNYVVEFANDLNPHDNNNSQNNQAGNSAAGIFSVSGSGAERNFRPFRDENIFTPSSAPVGPTGTTGSSSDTGPT